MTVDDRQPESPSVPKVKRSFWNRFWKNKQGKVIIWQFPNPPLYMWAFATIIGHFMTGRPEQAASLIAFGSLFTVGYLELYRGVNYFRHLLGLVILIVIIANRL